MLNTFPGKFLSGSSLKQARFVAGAGNWDIPGNLVGDFVLLTLVGAGGGGGFDSNVADGAGGGGGGETIYRFPFFVNPLVNSSIAYSVGAAGGGGDGSGGSVDGTDGGDSTFDFLTCEGGGKGIGTVGGQGGAGGGVDGGAGGTSGVDGGDGTLAISGEMFYRWGGGGGGAGSYNVNTPSNAGDSPLFQGGGGQWQAGDLAGPGGGGFTRGGYRPGVGSLVVPEYGAGGAGGLGAGNVSGQDGGSGLILIEYSIG